MRRLRWALMPVLLPLTVAAGEGEDYFAFIPEGGRTLVAAALDAAPDLAGLIATGAESGDWQARIAAGQLPGLAGLDAWQAQTVADYLAYAAPVTGGALPPDGRDMTLERCQSCHIVTVVVTQARAKAAWLGTLGKPSHVGIPLSAAERGQLADYLSVNAGLPIDVIPPELRAGGASY